MLPPSHRLRQDSDFRRLRQTGRRVHHPLVILIACRNGQPQSRIGFIASRRVGNSVTRNRAKRLLREAVRGRILEIEAGWDLLFVARHPVRTAALIDVANAVDSLLTRVGALPKGAKDVP